MAGGMSKGRGGVPLAQRTRGPIEQLHGTVNTPPQHQPGPGPLYGQECRYRELPGGPRHVMVTADERGPRPGLLVGWRRHPQLPWEGLVWHPRLVEGRWVLANVWWPAGAIEPTAST